MNVSHLSSAVGSRWNLGLRVSGRLLIFKRRPVTAVVLRRWRAASWKARGGRTPLGKILLRPSSYSDSLSRHPQIFRIVRQPIASRVKTILKTCSWRSSLSNDCCKRWRDLDADVWRVIGFRKSLEYNYVFRAGYIESIGKDFKIYDILKTDVRSWPLHFRWSRCMARRPAALDFKGLHVKA